jgi:hypothetical protein
MARIGPRDYPFTEEVEGFWNDESTSVSVFTTRLNNRDGVECIIGKCDYNISAHLDLCHIIQKNDEDTVSTPSSFFYSLTHLLVAVPST